jgi:hypothetical protein
MRDARRFAAAAWLVACACSANATVGEKAQGAATAASGVATKVERAVKRGVSAAASGVERGAKAAGRAADRGAKKIGVPGAGASSPARSTVPQSAP